MALVPPRAPPSTVTTTLAGDPPGSATASVRTVAPATAGAPGTPGPITSQPVEGEEEPEDAPHPGA